MKILVFIRFLCAWSLLFAILAVAVVIYHLKFQPIGFMNQWIPRQEELVTTEAKHQEVAVALQEAQEVQVDPGEKVYRVAQELLVEGKKEEAKEKFRSIYEGFPESSCAASALRIVGEMNVDDVLSASHKEGKVTYTVVRGDVLVGIASKHQTTLENMMHLNSLFEFKSIQPGNEFVILPLNFRLVIDHKQLSLSVWDEGKIIKQYVLLGVPSGMAASKDGKLTSKSAEWEGKKITAQMKYYGGAAKVLQISNPNVTIRGWDGVGVKPSNVILMKNEDLEELNLLTRAGNEVEIR